jgi:hypothetical protein
MRRRSYVTAMTRHRPRWIGLLLLLLISASTTLYAATAKKSGPSRKSASQSASERLGAVESWTAYTYKEKSGKVCYITSEPQKTEPAGRRRKQPMVMVTHRPGEKVENVVSFVEGYPLKDGSDVSLEIGDAKYDLFTKSDSAWARTAELDKTIVEAMTKGKQAVVKGMPRKGSATTDTYSLAGFTQALALIDKACEVKR